MWVRFLDKTSQGTLFNFGNPTREENPIGFKLETIVDINAKRYVRLLVLDNSDADATNHRFYDSHVGYIGDDGAYSKVATNTSDPSVLGTIHISQYTEIPSNFTEWIFICATYDPAVTETLGVTYATCESNVCNQDPYYWLNHIDSASYTAQSFLGNRAKVEFISRSDLLRARGYKI